MKTFYLFLCFSLTSLFLFGQTSILDIDAKYWEGSEKSLEKLKEEIDELKHQDGTENQQLLLESIYAIRKDSDPVRRIEILIELSERNAETHNKYSAYANYHISSTLSSYKILPFALDYSNRAIEDSKAIHDQVALYLSYKNKAGIYFQMKEYAKACDNFKLAGNTIKNPNINQKASDLNNIALCYLELHQYEKAIQYFQDGISILRGKKEKDDAIFQLVQGNLGTAYVKSGRIEQGKKLLEEERIFYELTGNYSDNYVSTLMQLLAVETDTKQQKKYARELFTCLDQVPANTNRLKGIETLMSISEKQPIGISATELNVLHNRILIDHLTQQAKLHDGLTNFLYEEKIKTLVSRSKKQQKSTVSGLPDYLLVILCSLFIIIILTGLFLFKRRIKRKTQELIEKEESKESVLARQQLLEREMENQQQQLNMLITNLKIKQQTESGFLEKIKELKRNKNATTEQVIKELQLGLTNLFDIDKKLITESSADLELDLDIGVKIKEKHPDLSQTEVQMCSYFINELSAKEIGLLLNISDISVRVAKNKIKKKIGLSKDENLNEYLQSLTR